MNLTQILTTLTEEPMLITPAAHASLLQLFKDHAQLSKEDFKAKREGVDWCGKAVELKQAEVIDGIMHLPISGPIGRGLGPFEKGAGAVDVADIIDELDAADADFNVYAVILDIDSPGGMVSGTPELAEYIASFEKPIYAFTAGMMCSAAYWIAAACDMICATSSTDIGSIGVYTAFLDRSKMFEEMGLKMEVITSGKFKGGGMQGTSLNADHRQQLQERIDEIAEMFYSHVEFNRPDSSREDMQGQVFKGGSALDKGLIDQLVYDKSDVVDLLS